MRLVLLALIGCGGHLAVNSDQPCSPRASGQRDDAAAPGVEALLHAYENVAPVLSPDGSHVLFRSDRGGSSELYLAETAHPEAAPQKLVPGPERVASAVFTADGTAVLFRRDTGADENFHIFRIAVDGSGLFDLTPDKAPLWRDSPLVRGGAMIYAARTATDYASKIIVQEGATTRIAYQDALPGTAIDASADGSHALFIREALAGGHELPPRSTSRRRCRADARAARRETRRGHHRQRYAPDGRIFVADRRRHRGSRGARARSWRNASSRRITRPTRRPRRSSASMMPSPRGDRVAIMVDAGDVSTVRVPRCALAHGGRRGQDAARRRDARPRQPRSASGSAPGRSPPTAPTSRSGSRPPRRPDEIFLADTATSVIAPLPAGRARRSRSCRRSPRRSSTSPPSTASRSRSTSTGHQRPGRLPVIVSFHGSPEASSPFEWSPTTRVLTSFGFVVLEPNIRGSTGFGPCLRARPIDREKRADSLEDVASVSRWARTPPWCDPDRLIVEGGSYGGCTSCCSR